MKTILFAAVLPLLLGACAATSPNHTTGEVTDPSWIAFCTCRNYDVATTDSEIINEYLDTWCGSVEEEQALNL